MPSILEWIARTLAACLVLGFAAWGLAAGPSHADPNAGLMVRPDKPNQQLLAAGCKQYQEAARAVNGLCEKQKTDQLKGFRPQAVSQARTEVWQLQRIGQDLTDLGEPAGVDFQSRATELTKKLDPVIAEYKRLPTSQPKVTKQILTLPHEVERTKAALAKVRPLEARGRWEEMRGELWHAFDALEDAVMWLPYDDYRRTMTPLYPPLTTAVNNAHEQIVKRTAALLAEAIGKQSPDYAGLLGHVREATTGLQARNAVDFEGQSLTGPAIVQRVTQRWQELHLDALHVQALEWIHDSAADGPLREAAAKFNQDIAAVLAELIRADATRAGAADARALYTAHLAALAPLVSLLGDDALSKAVAGPLEQLAARSPDLAREVAGYRTATATALQWRQRTARARSKAKTTAFPSLALQYLEAVRSGPGSPGLVGDKATDTASAELFTSVPVMMPPVANKLMDKRVSLSDLVGFTAARKMAVARYRDRVYAQFTLPQRWDAAVAELEADLYVGPSSPPLTLEAAVAVETARRGDLAAAGGAISGLFLEPLVTRFATLPLLARAILPLGTMPQEPNPTRRLHQVIMRVDVQSAWCQHRYFFVEQ